MRSRLPTVDCVDSALIAARRAETGLRGQCIVSPSIWRAIKCTVTVIRNPVTVIPVTVICAIPPLIPITVTPLRHYGDSAFNWKSLRIWSYGSYGELRGVTVTVH